MYGTNPVAKSRSLNELFQVHSMFYTIQGEGPFAGTPAVFLRMGGCNLRCFWCDTEFDEGVKAYDLQELCDQLQALCDQSSCSFVVITGGEPMLQPIGAIMRRLDQLTFQVETAGTVWPVGGLITDGRLSVVCSPKTGKLSNTLEAWGLVHGELYWKYIISWQEAVGEATGLPIWSTQVKGARVELARPPATILLNQHLCAKHVFVQGRDEGPVDDSQLNMLYAAEIAMKYGFRFSLQQHKIIDVD